MSALQFEMIEILQQYASANRFVAHRGLPVEHNIQGAAEHDRRKRLSRALCATHQRFQIGALVLREDGGIEVSIPGWGHVGEVVERGVVAAVESIGWSEQRPPSNHAAVEAALDRLAERALGPRRVPGARAEFAAHPIADVLRRLAAFIPLTPDDLALFGATFWRANDVRINGPWV